MSLPDFNYATVEFINTWKYDEDYPGSEGSMAIVRLHSNTTKDVLVALFAASERHQSAFENLFATKAKFQFTVSPQERSLDQMADYVRKRFVRDEPDTCGAKLIDGFIARAIYYPVCP
ncbi:MAG: hypothetical protein AMXMBFR84_41150 [Candidatus Hydrogenedentota bacterium]